MSKHFGSISFRDTPDVNGELVVTKVLGTSGQVTAVKTAGDVTVSISDNPVLPGTGSVRIPSGPSTSRPATAQAGDLRVNTTLGELETYDGANWVPPGVVLGVTTRNITSASGTTTVPLDNSIPTSTEGWQFFSITYTPKTSTSKLVIDYSITAASSAASATIIASIFVGTTNIGSTAVRTAAAANTASPLSQKVVYTPNTTNPITITGRIGSNVASTTYVNTIGNTTLGSALVSALSIVEIS